MSRLAAALALPLLLAATAALADDRSICNLEWKETSADNPVPDGSFQVQGDNFGQGAGYVCSCNSQLNGNPWSNVGGLVNSSYVGWTCVVSAPYPQGDNTYCKPGSYYVLQGTAGLKFVGTEKGTALPRMWVPGPKVTSSDNIGICSAVDTFVSPDGKRVAGSVAYFVGKMACQFFDLYSNFGVVGGHSYPGNYEVLVC